MNGANYVYAASGTAAMSLIGEDAASLIADAMFALSAPSRVQILGCLLDGPLAVGEITALLGMEQSAVSHQLRVLREAELVNVKRHGKRRLYAISGDAVRELLTAAGQLAAQSQPGGPRRQDAAEAAGA
jgi:ArsR family transcriptional regulator, nickel/cobalt-responsive transcriptional repressor